MIALVEAYTAHLFSIKNIFPNILSGIIVGIIAFPLSMAFAIAAGATPASGIYTAIIAGLIVGIFGGTRVQISGPTGAFVAILSTIQAQHGFAGLQYASILAGILLLIMGMCKLGNIVKFIPYPVIVGFTTGIGIVIFVGQWQSFLGLTITIDHTTHFLERLVILGSNMYLLNPHTTELALLSVCWYIISKRFIKIIPAPLTTLIVGTLISIMYGDSSIATIESVFGTIPQQLPTFFIPLTTNIEWSKLIIPACTISLLGAIESLLSATAIDTILQTKHNPNQELIGQGLANIITPFFGGFASTGAIARTITNVRNGGNSPLAAIIHSITLILILLLLAPLASHIPLCVLAAILCVIAYNMSDVHQFRHIAMYAPWYDTFVLFATCALTITIDLVFAVLIGTVLAYILAIIRLYQTSKSQHISAITLFLQESYTKISHTSGSGNTMHVTIQGPFYFGAIDRIEQALSATSTDPKIIIFNFQQVPYIDVTGLTILHKVLQQYHQRNITIIIEHANESVFQKLQKFGILKLITTQQN